MNIITVAGTIGKDAELRNTQSGESIAQFSVADSQGKDKTIWWRCNLWGKRATSLVDFLHKGQRVTVCGRVDERKWTDKDGNDRVSYEINVQDVALQGSKQDRQESQPEPRQSQRQEPQRTAPAKTYSSDFSDMDSDIPFRDPLSYKGAHLVV